MKAVRLTFGMMLIWHSSTSWSHNGENHQSMHAGKALDQTATLAEINQSYLATVKPIFQKSCFACHAQNPSLPWYHSVPLVRGLLDRDMSEAKEHLDFTNDFPFTGHGSPKEDLEAISKSIKARSMPPMRYRMMHPGSALTVSDRETVLKWTERASELVND